MSSDWDRFLVYAKRIREFDSSNTLMHSSQTEILSQCPGGVLFPNLRLLRYVQYGSYAGWPWLKILVAPTLQTLTLYFLSLDWVSIKFISNLPQMCPAIRDLTLRAGTTPVAYYSDLICSWTNLDRINITACDGRALTHLSLMHSLSELDISTPSFPPSTHFTSPALRRLRMHLYDFNSCLEFMRGISAARLSTLDISLKVASDTRWCLLFQVISEKLRDAPLSHLRFDLFNTVDYHGYTDDIRPLYSFPNVTTFAFDSATSFMLDDHWIQEIASAWPNLTSFRLDSTRYCPKFTRVTLAGLAYLVRKCQHLSNLYLQIDARIDGPLLEIQACGLRPNACMRSISLGCSPIEDVPKVARFLARALPNLRHIKVDHSVLDYPEGERTIFQRRWMGVTAWVHEIQDGLASRSKQG
jgi:hypothetical protein